jgi:hypothetical protein
MYGPFVDGRSLKKASQSRDADLLSITLKNNFSNMNNHNTSSHYWGKEGVGRNKRKRKGFKLKKKTKKFCIFYLYLFLKIAVERNDIKLSLIMRSKFNFKSVRHHFLSVTDSNALVLSILVKRLQCLEPGAAGCGFRPHRQSHIQTAKSERSTAKRSLTDFHISHFSGSREVTENEDAIIVDTIEMMEFHDNIEGEAIELNVEDPKTLLLEAIENAKEMPTGGNIVKFSEFFK